MKSPFLVDASFDRVGHIGQGDGTVMGCRFLVICFGPRLALLLILDGTLVMEFDAFGRCS